jgi:hypothetical protein
MKYFIKIISLIGLFTISQFAYSASVTDTYSMGDTLTADTLNNLKSAVNDNDARVDTLESITPVVNPDYSGYGPSFSADGTPKNVVVLERDNGDGTITYLVNVYYANSSEQVSIEGALVIRPFIVDAFFLTVDSGGNLTDLSNWIEAPLTSAYLDYVVEASTYDVNTLVKTVTNDTERYIRDCSGGGGAISQCDRIIRTSGSITETRTFLDVYTLLGAGTINSISYDNLRGRNRSYYYLVTAKGIGEVISMYSSSSRRPRAVIYYRVDGKTGGSLEGTIFAPGEKLEGVLF